MNPYCYTDDKLLVRRKFSILINVISNRNVDYV